MHRDECKKSAAILLAQKQERLYGTMARAQQSQGGVGSLPIDISEQMMPMLSLRLYVAIPQCGRLHAHLCGIDNFVE